MHTSTNSDSVFTCRNVSDLRRLLAKCDLHYLDTDTLRFFRARILGVYPTHNGAVLVETIGAGFDIRDGRAAKCVRFSFAADNDGNPICNVETLFQGLGSDLPLSSQIKLAKRYATLTR